MDVNTNSTACSWIVRFVCLVTFSGLVVGCGSGDKQSPEKKADNQKSTALAEGQLDPAKQLVGTWYGKAQLDPERLAAKIKGLSQQEGQRLQMVASVFQTTEIGARFDADGMMELDIQVKPNGQVLRDSTSGNWTVLEVEKDAVIIETVEPLPAGGTEKNRVRYQFSAEGNRALMVAPTSELLADCHPLFVFERVRQAQQSEPTESKIADRADGSEVR